MEGGGELKESFLRKEQLTYGTKRESYCSRHDVNRTLDEPSYPQRLYEESQHCVTIGTILLTVDVARKFLVPFYASFRRFCISGQ
ncbi:hypothetical protein MKW98_009069 [Papaver atlanticum]|uniref:Uncharacterized protein n=1 Tax=Papaver atlanticum TaxID=357466 RepID=A0AAD4RX66_9MAGN|nr:hypothetical protein MKW98_009069 [Papaver atlanticum]